MQHFQPRFLHIPKMIKRCRICRETFKNAMNPRVKVCQKCLEMRSRLTNEPAVNTLELEETNGVPTSSR